MKEESLSTKSMLLDMRAMRDQVQSLLEKGKPYNELLRVILSRDSFCKEERPITTLKELCAETGFSTGKVKKLLEKMYFDLALTEEEPRPVFSFTRQRFEFLLYGWRKKYLNFTVNRLPNMPRVGENISIPFFSAILGTTEFYVEHISYGFEGDTQIAYLHLINGYFNPYWHLRKAKAVEEGEPQGDLRRWKEDGAEITCAFGFSEVLPLTKVKLHSFFNSGSPRTVQALDQKLLGLRLLTIPCA